MENTALSVASQEITPPHLLTEAQKQSLYALLWQGFEEPFRRGIAVPLAAVSQYLTDQGMLPANDSSPEATVKRLLAPWKEIQLSSAETNGTRQWFVSMAEKQTDSSLPSFSAIELLPSTMACFHWERTGDAEPATPEDTQQLAQDYRLAQQYHLFRPNGDGYQFPLTPKNQQHQPMIGILRPNKYHKEGWVLAYAGTDRFPSAPMSLSPSAPVSANQLPMTRENQIFLSEQTLRCFNREVYGDENLPVETLAKKISADYDQARQAGAIRKRHDTFTFPLSLADPKGRILFATIKHTPGRAYKWSINYAGPIHPGEELEYFAYLGHWDNFLSVLSAMALPEVWDFPGMAPKMLLRKYIQYTFYRLRRENKVCISEDNTFAAFNTGLVDAHYCEIYACFGPNPDAQPNRPLWRHIGFCTAGSEILGKRLVSTFAPPAAAAYFDRSAPPFFDITRKIYPDYQHILLERIHRLPLGFLRANCQDAPHILNLLDALAQRSGNLQELYSLLRQQICGTPHIYKRLSSRIDDAIVLAEKQVRWNYKLAIPCYFPAKDALSMLLPLSLEKETKPDCGLVVELTPAGNYQGQTILTLQQAYIDARLLCRLSREWLDIQAITAAAQASA